MANGANGPPGASAMSLAAAATSSGPEPATTQRQCLEEKLASLLTTWSPSGTVS